MSSPFFNKLGVSKLFLKLNMLPNIPAPCCVLRFLCCLGPIVYILFIVTFAGNFFLLTLSYLAKKCICRVKLLVVMSLFYAYLLRLCLLPPNYSFITTPLNEPNMGAANAPLSTSISSTAYIPNTSPYQLLFHSKKLPSSCTML